MKNRGQFSLRRKLSPRPSYEVLEPDVPVLSIFNANLTIEHEWSADKPILLTWLDGKDGGPLPSALASWLEREAQNHRPFEVKVIDLPYQHAFNAEKARFGYAWLYPR